MTDISDARRWHDRPNLGIVLMLISVFIHMSGIVFEKMLLGVYSVPQLSFYRALLRLIPLFITVIRHREIKAIFEMKQPLFHFLRLTAYVSYNYCMLYALSKTSLTMIGSLQYITPFIIIGLSSWLLKEKLDRSKWIAIGIATIGIMIAIRPFGKLEAIAFVVLFASLLGSFNKIAIRKLTATEHSLAITVYGNLAMVLVSFPFILVDWHPLSWHDLVCFGLAGTLTATAQFAAVQALRFAQASTLAPLDCSSIVWGVVFDFFIWQLVPSAYLLIGASIVICSNFYLWRVTTSKFRLPEKG